MKQDRATTAPEREVWPPGNTTLRRVEATAVIGYGDVVWQRAADQVLRWEVKTRSGFTVDAPFPVTPGQQLDITVRILGLTVVEPVEVVSVIRDANRTGFSYRTLPGHPVDGEESFIISRHGEEVSITVRSLTRASRESPWRLVFPFLLIGQRIVRRRYLRALR